MRCNAGGSGGGGGSAPVGPAAMRLLATRGRMRKAEAGQSAHLPRKA